MTRLLLQTLVSSFVGLLATLETHAQTIKGSRQTPDDRPLVAKLVAEKDISRDVQPKWCYGNVPQFIFLQNSALIKSDLQFTMDTLANFDRPANIVSLQCSQDGTVISFLSARNDRLYVYQNEQLSTYELSVSPLGNVRYGSLMSPDGTTFAVPASPVHLAGPDILSTKRIVRVETFDVFWTSEYLITRSAANTYSIKALGSLKQLSSWTPPPTRSIEGFFQCGERSLFLQRSDSEDNKSLTALSLTAAGVPQLKQDGTKIDEVGAVDTGRGQCLVSTIALSDVNVSIVDRLILLRGGARVSATLRPLMFTNSRFSLSKQAEYVVSFQSNILTQRPGGRIVILSIGG